MYIYSVVFVTCQMTLARTRTLVYAYLMHVFDTWICSLDTFLIFQISIYLYIHIYVYIIYLYIHTHTYTHLFVDRYHSRVCIWLGSAILPVQDSTQEPSQQSKTFVWQAAMEHFCDFPILSLPKKYRVVLWSHFTENLHKNAPRKYSIFLGVTIAKSLSWSCQFRVLTRRGAVEQEKYTHTHTHFLMKHVFPVPTT